MNLTFIDTETTGIKEHDVIIQLWLIHEIDGKVAHEINSYYSNWDVRISLISKATHGILENDINDFPIFWSSASEYKLIESIKNSTIFIGHNVQFDISMLSKTWLIIDNFIDTLKITKHLMQAQEEEFENTYRLDVLKYYLMEKWIQFPNAKTHDAMGDTLIVRIVFHYLFSLVKTTYNLNSDEETLDKMIELTNSPILLIKINFGKHKWSTFEEIAKNDPSYLDWLAKNTEDENVRFTCRKYL